MNERLANIDILLAPLLLAASDEEANACLSQLITAHIGPVIKSVIRYKLRFRPSRAAEADAATDIEQEAVAQLLVEIERLRRAPGEHPIGDLRALAAVIAQRACAMDAARVSRTPRAQKSAPLPAHAPARLRPLAE